MYQDSIQQGGGAHTNASASASGRPNLSPPASDAHADPGSWLNGASLGAQLAIMELAPQLAKLAAQEKQLNTKVGEAKMDFSKDEQAAILAAGAADAVKELAGAAAAGLGAGASAANIARSVKIEGTRDKALADLDAGAPQAFQGRSTQAQAYEHHKVEAAKLDANKGIDPNLSAGDKAQVRTERMNAKEQAQMTDHLDKQASAKDAIRQDIQAKHMGERQKIEASMTLVQEGSRAVSGVIGAGGTMMSAIEQAERSSANTAGQMMDSWMDGIGKAAQKAEDDCAAALELLKNLSPRISFDGKG